jgi:hypothetical protein
MQFPHNYAIPQQMFYNGGIPPSSQQPTVAPPWMSVYSGLNPFFSTPLMNPERILIANQASSTEQPKKKTPNLSKRALEARRYF